MLKSIHLQGFKGFKNTKIDPLRKVNLILGGQNVGKTSLLEAVYFGGADSRPLNDLPLLFRSSEGHDADRYWNKILKGSVCVDLDVDWHFRTSIGCHNIRDDGWELVSGFVFGNVVRTVSLISDSGNIFGATDLYLSMFKYISNPLAIFVHLPGQLFLTQLLDKVVMARKKRKLIEMLRGVEPRLEDIHSLSPDGELRIYVELDGEAEALPLPQLGHGFSRLVNLYCSLLDTNAKLALIDEVENGIHYSSLPIVFNGIQDMVTNNGVQTLITTHSWEAIRAAYNVFVEADALDDFQLIRLEREGDNVRAVIINDEQLVTAMESGYEIR